MNPRRGGTRHNFRGRVEAFVEFVRTLVARPEVQIVEVAHCLSFLPEPTARPLADVLRVLRSGHAVPPSRAFEVLDAKGGTSPGDRGFVDDRLVDIPWADRSCFPCALADNPPGLVVKVGLSWERGDEMTAQAQERLLLDGHETRMSSCPPLPEGDPRIVRIRDAEVANRFVFSTACYRRYIGTWKLEAGRFFLVNLDGVFRMESPEPIFADWVTEVIKFPEGEVLDDYMGIPTLYEFERRLTIERGILVEEQRVDNRPRDASGEPQVTQRRPPIVYSAKRAPADGPLVPTPKMEISGVRLLAPMDERRGGDSWRAEDERGSPMVVRFIHMVQSDEYGGKNDARPGAFEALGRLVSLSGRPLPAGIVPWRSVELSRDGTVVVAVRPFLPGRLWDEYAPRAEEALKPLPPAGLKQAFIRLGEALDALHRLYPDAQLRIKPNNLLTDGGEVWLSDSGLDGLLRLSSEAVSGPRRLVWDPINGVLCFPGGMPPHFLGNPEQRAQAELAAAYFAIRTGQPLFYRDVKSPTDESYFRGLDEVKEYQSSRVLRLDPLTDKFERACLGHSLALTPWRPFPNFTDFGRNLRTS
jgi:hypothetical protein